MNYVRTSAGGMMAITFKTNTLNMDKKQTTTAKPTRKLKKGPSSAAK